MRKKMRLEGNGEKGKEQRERREGLWYDFKDSTSLFLTYVVNVDSNNNTLREVKCKGLQPEKGINGGGYNGRGSPRGNEAVSNSSVMFR